MRERKVSMNLVTLQDIVFGYSHTPVLDGVSLEIKSGEFVGIILTERRVKIDAHESHARHAQTLGRNGRDQ